MGYFWGLGKVQKLFWGVLIWTTNFRFLKEARFGLYHTDQVLRGGLDGRADERKVIIMPLAWPQLTS